MSVAHFQLLVANAPASEAAFAHFAERLFTCQAADALVRRRPGMLFVASGDVQIATGDGLLVTIGPVFRRDRGMARLDMLDGTVGATMRATEGRSALSQCWGSYVAVVDADGRLSILRDPSGAMPCYYAERDGLFLVASSIDPMIASGFVSAAIDWTGVAGQLIAKDLRLERTCLETIRELPRGSRLILTTSGHEVERLWDPWQFACGEPVRTELEAASRLRETVQSCVTALASRFSHAVLGVSGGLDSSIIAACLAETNVELSCITLATDDPLGDERDFARTLCGHLGLSLSEAHERLGLVDVTVSHARHLPRPIARAFAQSGNMIQQRLADQVGAQAYFSGSGGDNVFCYLASAAPIADRILAHGLGWGAVETARDIAHMRGATFVQALRKGIARAWLRPARYTWPLDLSLLSPAACEMDGDWLRHPWLKVPGGGLPGKAAHIAWLLGIENHLEGYRRELQRPMIAPLMAQPVVELCLAIPSWMWCAGGRNRAIARMAFCDRLPRAIIERRSKGTPGPFVMQILDVNRERVRDMLTGGALAQQGLIDAPAIERSLSRGLAITEVENARIMHLLDVEAWLRCWQR